MLAGWHGDFGTTGFLPRDRDVFGDRLDRSCHSYGAAVSCGETNRADYDLPSNIAFATKSNVSTSPELRLKVPRYAIRGRACVCSSFARRPFRSRKSRESGMPKALESADNVLR